MPCRIDSWKQTSPTQSSVVFTTPAWQGGASAAGGGGLFLSAVVKGTITLKGRQVSYLQPCITATASLNGTFSSQGGEILQINGTDFGNFASLGELWGKSGAASMGYGKSLPLSLAPSSVALRYLGAPDSAVNQRDCAIVLWSDELVQCKVPQGVGGSRSKVTVSQNISVAPHADQTKNVQSYTRENDLLAPQVPLSPSPQDSSPPLPLSILLNPTKNNSCLLCDAKFSNLRSLTRHRNTMHSQSNSHPQSSFTCDTCGATGFSRKDSFQRHVKRCNSNKRNS